MKTVNEEDRKRSTRSSTPFNTYRASGAQSILPLISTKTLYQLFPAQDFMAARQSASASQWP
jgi:hypothetical protein